MTYQIRKLIPPSSAKLIRQRLNNEPVTDKKSFHIVHYETSVRYTNDQRKKQLPKVICL